MEEEYSPNIIAYVHNAPANEVDPRGLWAWKGGRRQGGTRAIMIPADGDTTFSASMFAKLDPSETAKWLRDSAGNWVAPGEKIQPCMEYDSPNIVVIGRAQRVSPLNSE